jgi:hypothetical protein
MERLLNSRTEPTALSASESPAAAAPEKASGGARVAEITRTSRSKAEKEKND